RLRDGNPLSHARGRRRRLRRHRRHPYLALPQGASSRWQGRGLWPHVLSPGRTPGVGPSGASSSGSSARDLRLVHRGGLAVAGPKAGSSLQHPVAQAAETHLVPSGPDRPVRPPSRAQDRAADRAAISARRGAAGAGAAPPGRRDGQDRARTRPANVPAWDRRIVHGDAAVTAPLTPEQQTLNDLWEDHVRHEFGTRDTDATLETMVPDAYVNHVPVMTGGVGHDALRQFYSRRFIPKMPPDTEIVPISRTIGADRLVDEMLFR